MPKTHTEKPKEKNTLLHNLGIKKSIKTPKKNTEFECPFCLHSNLKSEGGLCNCCSNHEDDLFCLLCLEECEFCEVKGCQGCGTVEMCHNCHSKYCNQCMNQECSDCQYRFCDKCILLSGLCYDCMNLDTTRESE